MSEHFRSYRNLLNHRPSKKKRKINKRLQQIESEGRCSVNWYARTGEPMLLIDHFILFCIVSSQMVPLLQWQWMTTSSMFFGTRISTEMHLSHSVNINQLTNQVPSLTTDRFCCHAIKKIIWNHTMENAKNVKCVEDECINNLTKSAYFSLMRQYTWVLNT